MQIETNVPEEQEVVLLEDGQHELVIEKVDVKDSQKGTQYLNVLCSPVDDGNGVIHDSIFAPVTIPVSEKMKAAGMSASIQNLCVRNWNAFHKACETDSTNFDTQELVGKTVLANIKTRNSEEYGDSNQVKAWIAA